MVPSFRAKVHYRVSWLCGQRPQDGEIVAPKHTQQEPNATKEPQMPDRYICIAEARTTCTACQQVEQWRSVFRAAWCAGWSSQ